MAVTGLTSKKNTRLEVVRAVPGCWLPSVSAYLMDLAILQPHCLSTYTACHSV